MYLTQGLHRSLQRHPGKLALRRLGSADLAAQAVQRLPLPDSRTGGDALAAWPKADFVQAYGLTETAAAVCITLPALHRLGPQADATTRSRLASVGQAGLAAETRIVDEQCIDRPAGQVGQILVRGPMVMQGCWQQPEATAQVLQGDWLQTGDAGRIDEGGCLFIADRIRDMIITGGKNVYSTEVEEETSMTLHRILGGLLVSAALWAPAAQARVTRIVIDETVPVASPAGAAAPGIAYQQIAGRAFGELDPKLPGNALIQDIGGALDADGKARYVATFLLITPVDAAQASGLLWHDVPNRGRVFPMAALEMAAGDSLLASAWQGDNAGNTAVRPTASVAGAQWLRLPVAKGPGGERITGEVFGRIVNRAGPGSQPLLVQTNPVPYLPASLDTGKARLVSRGGENQRGEVSDEKPIPADQWAWAQCDAAKPFPGTPDATQICLKDGFDARRLYQVVYTAADPLVLGMGFAAWRDLGQFFKTAKADDVGKPNPVAGRARHSIGRGVSQSGNFLRGWLHLGFNQAEDGSAVHDGLWPIIAGRRIALNFRWAQPDGVLELYQAGSEGPQWWLPNADPVRGGPAAGLLDRCTASRTCPKVIEHFGSAEVWALKLTPEWVGTWVDQVPKADLPLPDNVRRYYLASSSHGGGAGGFDTSLPGVKLAAPGALCPGNNFGNGLLPANPMPHTETVNAIRQHFRQWVVKGTPPPPSRYPTLAAGQLAEAHKAALGFPTLPGLRATVPEVGFIMPVHDLDWGPGFNALDGSGIASLAPPRIKQVLRMLAPKVDADGNELGGVPVVLHDAPLGTYLGWNITAGGERPFHAGQICNYTGGMLPFARTRVEREAAGDPRPSLQERYADHDGYVAAVRRAADRAMAQGFLLAPDAAALIRAAQDSAVLH